MAYEEVKDMQRLAKPGYRITAFIAEVLALPSAIGMATLILFVIAD